MTNENEMFVTTPLQSLMAASTESGQVVEFLTERPFCSKISIRGDSSNAAFRAVFETLSLSLPVEANTVSHSGSTALFWMGPDEWLLHSDVPASELCDQLRTALLGIHSAIVDVSDYYTIIRLQTEHAREILARSTPFDLHGDEFVAGRCAQTKLGNAACLLHAIDESGTVDVQVRWSYAEYLWLLLVSGARSFDL